MPSLRGQTVRVLIVNANALKTKHDAILRFMDAYREAVDWMYADPKAVEMYSKKMKLPVDLLQASRCRNSSRRPPCRPTRWPISTARWRRGEAEIPRQAADQGAAGRADRTPPVKK